MTLTTVQGSLFSIAAYGFVADLKFMLPIVVVAIACIAVEMGAYKADKIFRPSVWFFLASAILVVGNFAWSSWTTSTPIPDILLYGETSSQLKMAIGAFALLIALLTAWSLFAGTMRVLRETPATGVACSIIRLLPLIPIVFLAIASFVRGNGAVGEDGLIALIRTL